MEPHILRIRPSRAATKSPSYLDAVDFLARHEALTGVSVPEMATHGSVRVLAHLFGIPPFHVALDVRRYRTTLERSATAQTVTQVV